MAVLQRLQRVGQVLELAVQVFLALGLFLIFLDGREVHRAEAADLVGDIAQCFFPGVHVGFGGISRYTVASSRPVVANCSCSVSRRTFSS